MISKSNVVGTAAMRVNLIDLSISKKINNIAEIMAVIIICVATVRFSILGKTLIFASVLKIF
mgnify:FL=1